MKDRPSRRLYAILIFVFAVTITGSACLPSAAEVVASPMPCPSALPQTATTPKPLWAQISLGKMWDKEGYPLEADAASSMAMITPRGHTYRRVVTEAPVRKHSVKTASNACSSINQGNVQRRTQLFWLGRSVRGW